MRRTYWVIALLISVFVGHFIPSYVTKHLYKVVKEKAKPETADDRPIVHIAELPCWIGLIERTLNNVSCNVASGKCGNSNCSVACIEDGGRVGRTKDRHNKSAGGIFSLTRWKPSINPLGSFMGRAGRSLVAFANHKVIVFEAASVATAASR
jgi:hypothetical protein